MAERRHVGGLTLPGRVRRAGGTPDFIVSNEKYKHHCKRICSDLKPLLLKKQTVEISKGVFVCTVVCACR